MKQSTNDEQTTTKTTSSSNHQTTFIETNIRTNEFAKTNEESLSTDDNVGDDNVGDDSDEFCGLNNGVGFILGGQDSKRGAFPFVALLGYRGEQFSQLYNHLKVYYS